MNEFVTQIRKLMEFPLSPVWFDTKKKTQILQILEIICEAGRDFVRDVTPWLETKLTQF
jgi:hypothetical protein